MIRGHGIPEAMEAVLTKQSRIAPRTAVAKPLSAAIAIGTGGPFGAEGPIIVTGGALGSLLGQVLPCRRRSARSSSPAARPAGMSATFGAPLAVGGAGHRAAAVRVLGPGLRPAGGGERARRRASTRRSSAPDRCSPCRPTTTPASASCPCFAVLGPGLRPAGRGDRPRACSSSRTASAACRSASSGTRSSARSGFAAVGLLVPRALGVGYDAIGDVLDGQLASGAARGPGVAKLVAWWVALASGTSGGTLAPMLLISGAFGSLLGIAGPQRLAPGARRLAGRLRAGGHGRHLRRLDPGDVHRHRLPLRADPGLPVILPLMLASVMADLVAAALLRDSLMTEKLTRRGLRVQGDYEVDVLAACWSPTS